MSKNYEKQTGNALIVVVIILVVVVFAVLGFVFWNNAHNSSTQKSDSNTSTKTNDSNTTPTPEKLAINDWSIGFTLPAELKASDIYYYKTHVGEGPDYYGFTTNRVRTQGDECDNQVTGNLITVTRSTKKTGDGTLLNDTAIGGYYYFEGSSVDDINPTPSCLQTDIATQDHASLSTMAATLSAE